MWNILNSLLNKNLISARNVDTWNIFSEKVYQLIYMFSKNMVFCDFSFEEAFYSIQKKK